MDRFKNLVYIILFIAAVSTLCSCVSADDSTRSFSGKCSRELCALGIKDSYELEKFFMANNPKADRAMVKRLAGYYVTEGRFEGINSDAAFCQMCIETGFLRFGGLVKSWMHNYCGLGSVNKAHPGEKFSTEALGVRAHIQHLHAYACTKKLRNSVVDPRYHYVKPRGKAPTVFKLSGTWASDRNYGKKLDALLSQLEKY